MDCESGNEFLNIRVFIASIILLAQLQQALAANAAMMEEVKAMRRVEADGYETGEERDTKKARSGPY